MNKQRWMVDGLFIGINKLFCLFQVLLKCLMVLQEIPAALKQKWPGAKTLYHMVACITHYVAMVIGILVTFCMISMLVEFCTLH